MLSKIFKASTKAPFLFRSKVLPSSLFSKQYQTLSQPTFYNFSSAAGKPEPTPNSEKTEEEQIEILDRIESKGQLQLKEIDGDERMYSEECVVRRVNDKLLIKTTYGIFQLKGSLLTEEKIEKINTIYYVNDRASINYIRKVLKADQNGLVVFEPTSHYANVMALYKGYRKKVYAQFYGTFQKPRNPFKNCKNNVEIYNLNRRIKIQIQQLLTRVVFAVDYEGTLRLKGDHLPFSDTLKNLLTPQQAKKDDESTKVGFYKYNFLVPVSYWQGVHSSDEWEKAGIIVHALSGKKVYPLYGVWSPTSQNYLTLLDNYLESKGGMVKSRKNILDIGSGTGVLSFMVVQKTGSKELHAIDANPRAVECTKLNTQLLDMIDSIKTQRLDVVEIVKEGETEKRLRELKFPMKYEMMIANPPWITSTILNTEHVLDAGIYDPKEEYLQAIFKFAGKHLSVQSTLTKPGILLLYYSDLSQIIGLQKKNRIEELCKENNLTITNVTSTKFIDDLELGAAEKDPLANFKNQARVLLYEITRL